MKASRLFCCCLLIGLSTSGTLLFAQGTGVVGSSESSPLPYLWMALSALLAFGLGYWVGNRKSQKPGTGATGKKAVPTKQETLGKEVSEAPTKSTTMPKGSDESPLPPEPIAKDFSEEEITPPPVPEGLKTFLGEWDAHTQLLGNIARETSTDTDIKELLARIYGGRDVGLPGLRQLLEKWRLAQSDSSLTSDVILHDLSGAETQKNLSWLYRLQAITSIEPVRAAFQALNIDTEALRRCTEGIFGVLSSQLRIHFDLPPFGTQYSAETYDLVANNIGSLSSLDNGALLEPLRDWEGEVARPIIDVGALGLSEKSVEIDPTIAGKFPQRTSVAYYLKN